jgi:uncharacterized OsmC-like protein
MIDQLEVEAIYMERELVRVEFKHSNLVSDHPSHIGGTGKGPSPGDIMFAGLAAASVFCAIDAAEHTELFVCW